MNRHPVWCARDQRCGIGEHRAEPIVATVPGAGRVVLTRVQASNGRQYAEVRLCVGLDDSETVARQQLALFVADLHTVLRRHH
jgi:hypothetical protein